MKKILTVLALVGLVFMSGCSKKEDLSGKWNVTSLSKENVAQALCVSFMEIKNEGDVYLVSGNSGVNLFNGNFEAKNGKFIPSDKFASTKMMGSPEANEYEMIFLQALTSADSYELKDNILTITDSKDSLVLEFTKVTE